MARILITDDNGVERGLWEDCAHQIGSLADSRNRSKMATAILRLVQEVRVVERREHPHIGGGNAWKRRTVK